MSPPPNEKLYVTGLPATIDTAWLTELFGQYGTVKDCKVLTPSDESKPTRHALIRYNTIEEATAVKSGLSGSTIPGCDEPLTVEFSKSRNEHYAAQAQNQLGDYNAARAQSMQGMKGGYGGGYGGCGGGWGGAPPWAGGGDWGPWCKGKGKGKAAPGMGPGMEAVVKGFASAKVLPGSGYGNDDNALYLNGLPPDCDDIHLYRLCNTFGAIAPNGCTVMKGLDGWCKGIGFINFINASSVQMAAAALHGCVMPDGTILRAAPKTAAFAPGGAQGGGCGGPCGPGGCGAGAGGCGASTGDAGLDAEAAMLAELEAQMAAEIAAEGGGAGGEACFGKGGQQQNWAQGGCDWGGKGW